MISPNGTVKTVRRPLPALLTSLDLMQHVNVMAIAFDRDDNVDDDGDGDRDSGGVPSLLRPF